MPASGSATAMSGTPLPSKSAMTVGTSSPGTPRFDGLAPGGRCRSGRNGLRAARAGGRPDRPHGPRRSASEKPHGARRGLRGPDGVADTPWSYAYFARMGTSRRATRASSSTNLRARRIGSIVAVVRGRPRPRTARVPPRDRVPGPSPGIPGPRSGSVRRRPSRRRAGRDRPRGRPPPGRGPGRRCRAVAGRPGPRRIEPRASATASCGRRSCTFAWARPLRAWPLEGSSRSASSKSRSAARGHRLSR